ncbi:alpha/beta hydrolase domain-containing protein [Pseudofrankia inefficax]|uniref:Alpha/beta hydrolase domain-containing protein n=1 Tax=Pseudofrankia inefficax (strain DSM 45817 / CECT 9037 / DDB 130130 / EuI1c) TaxID=298654 RepID=E3J832_PSEI1|nr:alpha/beta hydrolase domain-containing protein [Pseudofrankia inefficax]ADP82080.1 hypothetical protein FraEuI1c_4079 [Pseudofrankia inefficax]
MTEVAPAELRRLDPGDSHRAFVPGGEYHRRPAGVDYVETEWLASGTDDDGHSYTTQVYVRLPRDPALFSGTVLVEPLHASGIAPIFMYSSPYVLRSGHGWVCVASQKSALDTHVKPVSPERYAALHIASAAPAPTMARPGPDRRDRNASGNLGAFLQELLRYNHASDAILAQVGAAIRGSNGPFTGVRHVLLAGHSQTGSVVTNYIVNGHRSHRLADGSSVFDGYLPTGCPTERFGPREVPIIQVISEGDVADPGTWFHDGGEPRHYRRPDSDDPGDRYRLYELAGVPHMGTRYPPHNNTAFWIEFGDAASLTPDHVMNSLPHNELFDVTLDHLVRWVVEGTTPPKADRIEVTADGTFAQDSHGNSVGGVRCVQLDVPRARYYSTPLGAAGNPTFSTIGFEIPFDAATMKQEYGDSAGYAERFGRRLDEIVRAGWLLPQDADAMRSDIQAATW